MHVYMYTYMYIYIYIHLQTHTYTHIYACHTCKGGLRGVHLRQGVLRVLLGLLRRLRIGRHRGEKYLFTINLDGGTITPLMKKRCLVKPPNTKKWWFCIEVPNWQI